MQAPFGKKPNLIGCFAIWNPAILDHYAFAQTINFKSTN